jgi:hypothetical protein
VQYRALTIIRQKKHPKITERKGIKNDNTIIGKNKRRIICFAEEGCRHI